MGFTDALTKHRKVLGDSEQAPQAETRARRAGFSALCALDGQLSHLKSEKVFPKKLSIRLILKALSAHHKDTGEEHNHLSATVSTGILKM